MPQSIKTILYCIVTAVVVAGITFFYTPKTTSVQFGGTTNLDTLKLSGSILPGGACAVSTAASASTLTLTAANFADCSLLSITSGTSTTLTVTLPASSTLSTFAATGDSQSLNIYSASTTGGSIVLAAGTGFSIESAITAASTTAATTTLSAGKMGSLNISRIPTTDLIGIFSPAK